MPFKECLPRRILRLKCYPLFFIKIKNTQATIISSYISSLLISKHFPESIKSIHSTFSPSDLTAVLYSFTDTFTLAQRSNCRRIKRVSCKQISSTFKEEKTANYEWSPGIQRGNTERHLEVTLHNFCGSMQNEITSTDWNIYVSFAFGFVISHAPYVTNV